MIAWLAAFVDDSMKVFLVLIIAGIFALLARRASRPSSTSSPLGTSAVSTSQQNLSVQDAQQDAPEDRPDLTWGPSAEEIAASLPADPLLGKIQIRKFYFAKTEAFEGPADPEVFADELFVQLYDPDTNWKWWQSYFVVTPKGLANVLQEKHWKYLHAPQMLAVPRYDLEEIRRAVVSRVVAEHEHFKGLAEKDQVQEETLD